VRRRIVTLLVSAAIVLASALPAAADPSFGPGGSDGQGNNSPHEMEPNCHAPGQTDELPQCR
jgi:hypothetical protein